MTPFDAMKNAKAELGIAAFKAIKVTDPKVTGVAFRGRWEARRFVIFDITALTVPISAKIHDFGEAKLHLPLPTDPKHLVADLRSFGMQVAARAKSPPWFEAVAGSDRAIHQVAHHHHVARCGYKGPWPEDHFVDDDALPKCRACAKTAAQARKVSMSK